MEIFNVTLEQMVLLFLFMVIGWVLQKCKMPADTGTVLSRLEVYVFLPALCFNTFVEQADVATILNKWPFLVISTIVLMITYGLSIVMAKMFANEKMVRAIYMYSITIPNLGYIGYPLVRAVFGEEMLLNYMLCALSYNIFIYTVGMYILTPNRTRFSLKSLVNAPMVAIVAGIVFGVLNIQLPEVLSKAMDSASGCMAPVAMMLTGFILAKSPLRKMIGSLKIYIASAIRLIVLPLGFLGIALLLKLDKDVTLVMTALMAMPFGLNSVIFPQAYGWDNAAGAQLCFVSNVLGIATIPAVFGLLSYLFGV